MPRHHLFNKTERERERENWQLPFNPMNLSLSLSLLFSSSLSLFLFFLTVFLLASSSCWLRCMLQCALKAVGRKRTPNSLSLSLSLTFCQHLPLSLSLSLQDHPSLSSFLQTQSPTPSLPSIHSNKSSENPSLFFKIFPLRQTERDDREMTERREREMREMFLSRQKVFIDRL